jgi:hypothetical protein
MYIGRRAGFARRRLGRRLGDEKEIVRDDLLPITIKEAQ